MPPRKSDASKMATDVEVTSTPARDSSTTDKTPKDKEKEKEKDGINIEDLNLPKSIVTRLAKGVLPPNTQIQGNAMLAMSKSATVFVNYLATHANDYAQGANRKTIAPADVLRALEDLEFDFQPRLEAELAKFNEVQAVKRNTYRKKVAADKTKGGSPSATGDGEQNGSGEGRATGEVDGDGERAAKKARVEGGVMDHSEMMMDDDTMGDMGDDNDIGEDVEEGDGEGGEEEFVDEDGDEEEVEGEGGEAKDGDGEPPEEDREEREVEDEALDNGEDSD